MIFEHFYDTPAELYTELSVRKYGDKPQRVCIGKLMCDIQPYKTGTTDKLAKHEYGMFPFTTKKLFCADNPLIERGVLVKTLGSLFRVIYIDRRVYGMMAILEEVYE